MPSRDIRSGFAMASLAKLRSLPLSEREDLLQGWVVWLDANRHRVSRKLEQELDRALRDLRQDSVGEVKLSELDRRFGEWLENAGEVGKGRGPDEDDA